MDILEYSRMIAELSDKIAEVNRRKRDRARLGERPDPDDKVLLADLLGQLETARLEKKEADNARLISKNA